jgi:tryptophan-rich sensory protein
MNSFHWYQALLKPSWAPPAWVFGPVWTGLYILIAVSFGTVFYRCAKGQLAWWVALPFALNLVFNLAFTPLQFGLRNNFLAAVDILLVEATLLWALWSIRPVLNWVAWINIPYLLWVTFATVLQLTITFLNRGKP